VAHAVWHRVEMRLRAVLLATSLATSLATGLLLAAVPVAHAETWRHSDAAGDALVTRYDDDGELTQPEVDPQELRGDLTNVRVTYGTWSLRVAATVRSKEIAWQDLTVTVVSSRGYTYRILVEYFIERTLVISRNGYRYRCDGLAATRTPAGYVVTVPRSCFDDAYRVRVGIQTYSGTDGGDGDQQTYDDFLRTGTYTKDKPRLSPWIVAG
jgi:hypothetical protein